MDKIEMETIAHKIKLDADTIDESNKIIANCHDRINKNMILLCDAIYEERFEKYEGKAVKVKFGSRWLKNADGTPGTYEVRGFIKGVRSIYNITRNGEVDFDLFYVYMKDIKKDGTESKKDIPYAEFPFINSIVEITEL